jgi:hexosaminidase
VSVTARDIGTTPVRLDVTAASEGEQVRLAAPELLVSVPYTRLADAFSNTGVTDDGDIDPPGLGVGLDGAGSSYSAQALAAKGLTPGATVTAQGLSLTWPDAAAGTPDNVVANGQSFRLEGSGSAIGLLTTATYGPATGDWVVHYADGTSTTARLSTPDWTSAPPAGSTAVADMTYRNNTETGRTARRSQVFLQRIPVDPSKEVTALTLPAVSATAVRGSAALHVFAVGLG